MRTAQADRRPLVAHVIFRLAVGGLENGLVNLLNRFPEDAYRHVVVSLTDATDFRNRIQRSDVEVYCLHKPPGHAFSIYPKLFRLFKELRPEIVHTRNLAALEACVPAAAAGVRVRIHGEHGYTHEPEGTGWRNRVIRRLYSPFVTHYIALSRDIERYLEDRIGIAPSRISRICNGVDTERFQPASAGRMAIPGSPFNDDHLWIVGTVGRMQPIKDQLTLARALGRAVDLEPEVRDRLRLVLAGEGPLREQVLEVLRSGGVEQLAWLAGERDDVPELLRGFDCFVLPSRGEGISNTILEAMACGLPVVATRVGGNAELVENGTTGTLTPAMDTDAMARVIIRYFSQPALARSHGAAGRARALSEFSLNGMVRDYRNLYDAMIAQRGRHAHQASTNAPRPLD